MKANELEKLFFRRGIRLFVYLIFVGITLVGLAEGYFADIGRSLIGAGKTYPSGYIPSVIFIFNFFGTAAAGTLFLFILRENKTLSFISLVLLIPITDYLLRPSENYSADFFQVNPENLVSHDYFLGELWAHFLDFWGAQGYVLAFLFSYLAWLFLKPITEGAKKACPQKVKTLLFFIFGPQNGHKLFDACTKIYQRFWLIVKMLFVYVFILAFQEVMFRTAFSPENMTLLLYEKISLEAQFMFLLLSHLCAGLALGKMLKDTNILITGGCSALLAALTYFFTWAKEFPLSFLATYFLISFLAANLVGALSFRLLSFNGNTD